MTKLQYTVTTAFDDPEILHQALNRIGRDGGRVVSVVWTPARTARLPMKEAGVWESGYTIIAEFEA